VRNAEISLGSDAAVQRQKEKPEEELEIFDVLSS